MNLLIPVQKSPVTYRILHKNRKVLSIFCSIILGMIGSSNQILSAEKPDHLVSENAPQKEQQQSKPRWKFEVSFQESIYPVKFTGRLYVFFSKNHKEPRFGPSWFTPEKFISLDVENLKPNESITLTSNTRGHLHSFPKPLAELDLAGYRAQAVIRFNPFTRKIGTGAGNGYSPVVNIPEQSDPGSSFHFVVSQLVPEPTFQETAWSKLLKVRSKLLSDFHKRDVYLHAAIILPASYFDHPSARFPTIFDVPGFGGTHFRGITRQPVPVQNKQGVQFLRVMLDASSPLGHHVFADSANNGPVGQALITELIPEFDRQYRSIAKPSARFLTGHSSGGWSTLWLQITYPDFFAGTWSTAPDPVDFRDFQRINLYESGENMYVDSAGNRRPLARRGDHVVLWYKSFDQMETTLGPGGQLHSFEAVFSPRGPDRKPLLAWDRKTGEVDTQVTKTWEKYDIRLILERNWKTLGPKLKGKLHVIMGDNDTFYLEGASILLKASLDELDNEETVQIIAGKNHFNLLNNELLMQIRSQMVDTFLQKHTDWSLVE